MRVGPAHEPDVSTVRLSGEEEGEVVGLGAAGGDEGVGGEGCGGGGSGRAGFTTPEVACGDGGIGGAGCGGGGNGRTGFTTPEVACGDGGIGRGSTGSRTDAARDARVSAGAGLRGGVVHGRAVGRTGFGPEHVGIGARAARGAGHAGVVVHLPRQCLHHHGLQLRGAGCLVP